MTEPPSERVDGPASGDRLVAPLVAAQPEPLVVLDRDGRVTVWNESARELSGLRESDVIGRDFGVLFADASRQAGDPERVMRSAREQGRIAAEVELAGDGGAALPAVVTVTPLQADGGEPLGYSARIGRRPREPIGLALEDGLFRELTEHANNPVVVVDGDEVIRYANPAAEHLFGYAAAELIGRPITTLMTAREREQHERERREHEAAGTPRLPWTERDFSALARDGTEIPVEVSFGGVEYQGQVFYAAIATDLRERKRAEAEAERRLTFLARASKELSLTLDLGKTLEMIVGLAIPDFADYAAVDLVTDGNGVNRIAVHRENSTKSDVIRELQEKYPPPEESGHGPGRVLRTGESELLPEVTDEALKETAKDETHLSLLRQLKLRSLISAPMAAHGRTLGAITLAYADSARRYSESDLQLVEDLATRAGLAIHNAEVVRDLEKIREELERQKWELEQTSNELRLATHRLDLHLEQTPLGAVDSDTEGRILSWNTSAEKIFGYKEEQAIGMPITFLVVEEDRGEFDSLFGGLLRREVPSGRTILRNLRKDGEVIHCEWYSTALIDDEENVIGVGNLVENITDRKEAEFQSQRQFEQLSALRSIDLAITASLDLRVTLSVLLDQVVSQLGVDAADILLLNPFTQHLEYAAGRGFRTTAVNSTSLLLGEGSSGRSALERRTLSFPSLIASKHFARRELLSKEEFVAHACTPLISKGKVTGVLEVFGRSHLEFAEDWVVFFEALAAQAAIAVDSTQIYEDLQQSNLELVLAYDSSLEGWARALDLRDNVTEGHSRRVTEMTVRLARLAGIEDEELVHIRRGALLHDIGKMGIPDAILHKNGPLTEPEWEVMKKHPQYAYDLLSPIDFLGPALDIPYAHHEHWDGTGYPRGLKGEEIPIAARLFAVVDVWDALHSDRSYNLAWPEDRIREHLRELAGTHLDPDIVNLFLSVDW